jgi:predicted AAA+ superfamily ATPase
VNSDGLKVVLQEFRARNLPAGVRRDQELPTDSGKVVALAGLRRSGKTFLFFQAIEALVARGVPRERILYLNFEDDRLHPLRAEELDLVLRCQRELFAEARTGRLYVFLDEVHSAPGWERWVRRLHDTEDVSLFVTGSSSALLGRDLSSALRGRSITLEVFPLSFREYLAFLAIEVVPFDADSESEVKAALADYLQWGGFPEVVLAAPEMRPLILEEYSSLMLWRDLVERHGLRNEALMRALLRHCFRNTATLMSLAKLHRDLGSQGVSVSRVTLHDYVDILVDAGLIHLLPVIGDSARKAARNPRKLHVGDPGLITAFKAGGARDFGHKLETAVFLQARRIGRDWRYVPGDGEVDLCNAEGTRFVNSCWRLVEEPTIEREVEALAFARRSLPNATGALLYHDAPMDIGARTDSVRPAWRWLLEQPSGPFTGRLPPLSP